MKIGSPTRISVGNTAVSLKNVKLHPGSQLLRVPPNSHIENLTLARGASWKTNWPALEGAVCKFNFGRQDPVNVDCRGLVVPTSYSLMDQGTFEYTLSILSKSGLPFKYSINKEVSSTIPTETLYMTHVGYCHPDKLFLPLGEFTTAVFIGRDINIADWKLTGPTLKVSEAFLDTFKAKASFNILTELSIEPAVVKTIIVQLKEGGRIRLTR